MTLEELQHLFVPHLLDAAAPLKAGRRLVHYTTAEAAFKIITGREVWMRNASMMNDFSEMQHGLECLSEGWRMPAGLELQALLDRLQPGLRNEIAELIDTHAHAFIQGTFITSLSLHDDDEDQFGRLSMWRAYGGKNGVAIVMNTNAFLAETDVMKVFSCPVFYQGVDDFKSWFDGWCKSICAAEERLAAEDLAQLKWWFFSVFRNVILSTKHPGFREEQEWRVFHSPVFDGESKWLEPATEVIGGIPQLISKLRLEDDEEAGIVGVAPATLIDRLIVGPCDHPFQLQVALCNALAAAGVGEPMSKISVSQIPLRH